MTTTTLPHNKPTCPCLPVSLWLPLCVLWFVFLSCDLQVLVVSACAFDSVPADLGVCFAASCLPQGYHLHTVESFLSIDTGTTFFVMK